MKKFGFKFGFRVGRASVTFLLIAATASALSSPSWSRAEVVFDIYPSDSSHVTVTGSGSLDLADATESGNLLGTATLEPDEGNLLVGPGESAQQGLRFLLASGPTSFGHDAYATADLASGDTTSSFFGVYDISGQEEVVVPVDYTSGDPLSGSDTYSGTLASLGLTAGATYTYTLPDDSLVINILGAPPAVVPEPGSLVGAGTAIALSLGGCRLRRRKARSAA